MVSSKSAAEAMVWLQQSLQIKQTTLNRPLTNVEANFFVTAFSIDRAF